MELSATQTNALISESESRTMTPLRKTAKIRLKPLKPSLDPPSARELSPATQKFTNYKIPNKSTTTSSSPFMQPTTDQKSIAFQKEQEIKSIIKKNLGSFLQQQFASTGKLKIKKQVSFADEARPLRIIRKPTAKFA